jgi:hypothetical protein
MIGFVVALAVCCRSTAVTIIMAMRIIRAIGATLE